MSAGSPSVPVPQPNWAGAPQAVPAPAAQAPGAGYSFFAAMAPNVICFFSSMTIMVLELVAGRLVSNNVGSSQYTWTSIIGVILAGMSIGNTVGGILADKYRPIQLVWVLFLVAAGSILLTIPLNMVVTQIREPHLAAVTLNPGGESWRWGLSILWMMSLVWIWPALALGLIGPVLAKMAMDNNRSTGRAIGNVYTWGAVGMVIGTFLTGFVLVSFIPVSVIIWVVAGAMAFLALLTALPRLSETRNPVLISAGVLLAICVGAAVTKMRVTTFDEAPAAPAAATDGKEAGK